jgi:hypothetical protein
VVVVAFDPREGGSSGQVADYKRGAGAALVMRVDGNWFAACVFAMTVCGDTGGVGIDHTRLVVLTDGVKVSSHYMGLAGAPVGSQQCPDSPLREEVPCG